MLSAAGANNLQSKVMGNSAKKNVPSRREYEEIKENDPSAHKRSVHHIINDGIHGHSRRSEGSDQQRRRSISRPRLSVRTDKIHDGLVEMKQRGKNGVDIVKQRSRTGVDTITTTVKTRSRTGVDRMKQTLPKKPNIRLKNVPKPLPSRSLFQHKPRTWLGTKKHKNPNKKEVDWRNARPATTAANKSTSRRKMEHSGSSTKEFKRSSTLERVDHGRSSSQLINQQPVGRSRSAPNPNSKDSYISEDYDWKQYIVE